MSGPARRSLLALLVVLATAAFGYEDTGFDPDDTQNCALPETPEDCDETRIGNPDIRSATRKVRQTDDGRRFLSVTIRSYEPVMRRDAWVGKIWLDSRGDNRADHRLVFRTFMVSRCGVDDRMGMRIGHLRLTDHAATCIVPLRFLEPTKRIRWRVQTAYYFPEPYSTVDVAPNGGGWYV